MAHTTKRTLSETLKKILQEKSLDKVTVVDIVEASAINRQTFYYHFKDIYDLTEWVCVEDAARALQGKKTYDSWQEGLLQIYEAVMENKPFIMNVYHSVSREQIENYLFKLTYDLIMGVVEEKSSGVDISEEEKKFIADVYKYSFVGIMLDWIKNGMREDYREIADDTATALYGSIDLSLIHI